MKTKKFKVAVIVCIIIQAVCIALLLAITFGKYSQTIEAYPKFEVEKFNAAILPVTGTDGQSSYTVTWTTQDFFPGMKFVSASSEQEQDTSARTAFHVANGTSEENATSLTLQYSIRIRTSNTLPLKYTLRDGDNYYETLGEPTKVNTAGSADTRYEYIFGMPVSATDSGGNTTETMTEATFVLEKQNVEGEGNTENTSKLIKKLHELIAEWPCVSDENKNTASISYMKEVEVVEIIVIATTVDSTDNTPTSPDNKDYYSEGVIFITPATETSSTPATYKHTVDLRAFKRQTDDSGAFNFVVDNALGQSSLAANLQQKTKYHMQLKVPATLKTLKDTETAAQTYVFNIFRNDVAGEQPAYLITNETKVTYRVYDEKLGTYGVYNTASKEYEENIELATLEEAETAMEALVSQAPQDEKGKYKIYYIYDIVVDELTNYTKDASENRVPNRDYHSYTLTIDKLTGITDSADNDLVFLNKLEILVDAPYVEVADSGNDSGSNNENGEGE